MNTREKFVDLFSGKKLIIPILIGLGVAIYIFYHNFGVETFQDVFFDLHTVFWLSMAVLMVFLRFLGYTYRLRILSDNTISWKSCFQITCLWEFASAITPGIVGGTAIAIGIIAQEKNVSTGKSTAMVMATSYLDVLFYVLCIPILAIFVGISDQIPVKVGPINHSTLFGYFIIAYIIFAVWTILVYIGLFVKPSLAGNVVVKTFSLPLLKRWKSSAESWKGDITQAAEELKNQSRWFWVKSFLATSTAWAARFALVNFLILALGNGTEVIAIFVKQLIMWGALMIPLTPGASGLAELLFAGFLGEYFSSPELANVTSVIWRLVSFYPYLIAGVIVFPIWLNRLFRGN